MTIGNVMKKFFLLFGCSLMTFFSLLAHPINNYKYVYIQHQEKAAKDVETRMAKEFTNLGFTVLNSDEIEQLDTQSKKELLSAKYRCRQSVECIFKIELINSEGEVIYEDEQIFGAGFISRRNDRQGAIKRIFKELNKLDYRYLPE